MVTLDRVSQFLNRVALLIAGVLLAGMTLLCCGNILLRIFWTPIKGTFEIMGFSCAVVIALGLGYTQTQGGHTGIDVVLNLFPAGARAILKGISTFVSMAFFIAVGWQTTVWATILRNTGEVTETLGIIFYPFTYGVALGCLVLALVLLLEFLKLLVPEKGA